LAQNYSPILSRVYQAAIGICLIIYISLSPPNLSGQEINCLEIITSEDGLSQSTVNCIIQDRDGFIWFGTQNGLNLYDGYHFTYFQNQPSDTTSLSDNYILSLCEDNEGNIWAGTMSGGLNRLNKKTGRFTVYNNSNSIIENTIWAVTVGNSGKIWTGSNIGVNVFIPAENTFKTYRYSETDTTTISSDMVLSFHTDIDGVMWIGTGKGLCWFDENSGTFHRITDKDPKNLLSDLAVWTVNQNGSGNILLGTNKGLYELDIKSSMLHHLSNDLPDQVQTVWSILPKNNGDILFGTRNGLKLFQYKDFICTSICDDISNTTDATSNNVWSLLKDNSGIVWTGTDNGAIKFDSKGKKFKVINNDTSAKLTLSANGINAILIDHLNTLWIGTEGGGLNRLDENTSQFKVYKKNKFEQGSISGNVVWAIIEDRDGIIWAGNYGDGLNAFDRTNETFTVYKRNSITPGSLSNNRILTLLEDNEGNIWIGTRGGGLNKFDKKSEKFEIFMHDPDNKMSVSSNTILSLAEDNSGNLWIGTFEGGLNLFNKQNKTFKAFLNDPNNSECLSNNNIWAILFDSKNRMWLGTQGGLNVCLLPNNDNLKFKYFTDQNGLSSNTVFGLTEDNDGNIWMSTFRGISKLNMHAFEEILEFDKIGEKNSYNPFEPIFKTYDVSDGLLSNEFNQGAYLKANDGTMYFGSLKGVNYFNPDSIKENTFNTNIAITDFKIFNRSVRVIDENSEEKGNRVIQINNDYFLSKKITYLDKIELTYRESVFSFDFASLDYTKPEKNNYAYKMDGFNSEWNFVAGQSSATYTNLDAGEYVFRVKATNSDGKWSTKEARLGIIISPPFWKTTWFILLMGLLFILALIYTVRRIISKQKEKERIEKERIELQLKTIKNQIDPHFAFNAMNMIGSLVYKNDPDAVYDYFTRFARLIRSTLQDSEKISRPLSEELEFVKNYVEIQKTRFKDKFDFVLSIDKKVDTSIEVPKMIIQTHIENAIKHGLMHKNGMGKLNVTVGQENGRLIISVEDNGVGRKKAAELSKRSTKKGMQIINQIFQLYYKLTANKIEQKIFDLEDSQGSATGTRVDVIIEVSAKY